MNGARFKLLFILGRRTKKTHYRLKEHIPETGKKGWEGEKVKIGNTR